MNNNKNERVSYLKEMEYHMWSKGLWDQRVVDSFFHMLMDIDNPNVLAQAVTSVLLVLGFTLIGLEKRRRMIVFHFLIGFIVFLLKYCPFSYIT